MVKPSKAEAKRIAAQARAAANPPPVLPAALVAFLDTFAPRSRPEAWEAVKDVHRLVMYRSGIRGKESFRKRCGALAGFLMWRYEQGSSVEIAEAMTFEAIDQYYLSGLAHLSKGSRNDYRSWLRNLAATANPGLAAPKVAPLGHQEIRPGYSRGEELAIMRIAQRQRSKAARRSLCAVVGLCAGAGLDAIDLRHLRRRHIHDRGEAGIEVSVPGPRPRRVMVRREYEQLVRIGIEGLRANDLLIGRDVNRRNLVSAVVENAEILDDDVPHIEASRLRATWLGWLMTRPVPIQVILAAAGLKTARSLVELIPHLPAPEEFDSYLLGETRS